MPFFAQLDDPAGCTDSSHVLFFLLPDWRLEAFERVEQWVIIFSKMHPGAALIRGLTGSVPH